MSSTFDGLYIARSGVRAARANLNVTGQNITNSTTPGYTRQRVDQAAITPPSGNDFYSGKQGAVSGLGSDAFATSQLRDAFLDAEYRIQNAAAGGSATLSDALSSLEDIFSYSTTAASSTQSSIVDVLSSELSNLISQMQNLTSGKSDASESVIRDAADQLAKKFNAAAKQLETAREQQYDDLSVYAVPDANDLLQSIAALNERIKSAEVSGGTALELRDQRNLKLDELSQYMDIRVEETEVPIGSGQTVHELHVYLADKDGNALKNDGDPEFTLVSDKQYAQVSVFQDADGARLTHVRLSGLTEDGKTFDGSNKGFQNADLQTGSLSSYLKLLNENGEYDIDTTDPDKQTATFRGIGYYSKLLDTLAQKFAETMNAANSTDTETKPLFTSDGTDTTDITAENIRLATGWTIGQGYLTTSKEEANPDDSTATSYSNITAMITALTSEKQDFRTPGENGVSIFNGTIQKAFMNVPTSLGQSVSSVNSANADDVNRLDNIDLNRQSISSVSIDDEAVDLLQFNQALAASARFMTAVDECLQTILNNMGLAGRG